MIKKSLEKKQGKRATADELGILNEHCMQKSNNSICSLSQKKARGLNTK
jgi:hypothetical protein